MSLRMRVCAWLVLLAVLPDGSTSTAQTGTVAAEQKLGEFAGGFGGDLDQQDQFGYAVATLGDLDGDGDAEIAVGASGDDDGGADQGAVWVLFLDDDGTVKTEQKISASAGGFGGNLDPGDRFGSAVAALGDLDGDGITELAVGAPGDDDGGFFSSRGAAWILFLNADGTVRAWQKISSTAGGFEGRLDPSDFFGSALGGLADFDMDGVEDLAVGAELDDDGGDAQGAVWLLFLNSNGTVKDERKISDTAGGFGGDLVPGDQFGCGVARLGDVDGDGVAELAVGAELDNAGGAVWILFMNADGTVSSQRKIANPMNDDLLELFGSSVAGLGDLDRDGTPDLAVGAYRDSDGGNARGGVWILFLRPTGQLKARQKISDTSGGLTGGLDDFDYFGHSVARVDDLDGDGVDELAVGAYRDSDTGTIQGAVWTLFLVGPQVECVTLDFQTEDDLVTPLVNGQHLNDEFGERVTLSSTGANAGMALFDSTIGGPNDPSQDRDLLVGTGHLLILQTENFPPDANDVFPRPNDDDDGGTVSFAFRVPVDAQSLRLIDIDATDGTTLVVLTADSGAQRTYAVPASWTGDRMLGQPGHGTLDLRTLAPQPGSTRRRRQWRTRASSRMRSCGSTCI